MDIAFAYELKPWLDLGVRANFLEFKKQTIINNEEIYYVDDYIPNYQYIGLSNYYGDRYYFGSAVAREGIRISLLFQPF